MEIENVEAVGIYGDEIRIVSKDLEPILLKRGDYHTTLEDIERVEDVRLGSEHRVLVYFKKSIACHVKEDRELLYCGDNPQTV